MCTEAHLDDEVLQRARARAEYAAAQAFADLRDEVEQGLHALEDDGVVFEVVEQGAPHGGEPRHDLHMRARMIDLAHGAVRRRVRGVRDLLS